MLIVLKLKEFDTLMDVLVLTLFEILSQIYKGTQYECNKLIFFRIIITKLLSPRRFTGTGE